MFEVKYLVRGGVNGKIGLKKYKTGGAWPGYMAVLLPVSRRERNRNQAEEVKKRVGIDPGHGGKDSGAVGPGGLLEKTVNLETALKLRRLLSANEFEVIMTRDKDVEISLSQRVAILNDAKCDLVISVHCNSSTNPADYVSTFILGKGGKAEVAAGYIQRYLVKVTGWPDGGVREANYTILKQTHAPAVLVEMGFISNPSQEKWLAENSSQVQLAEAIARGTCDFFEVLFTLPSDYHGHLHEAAIKEAIRLGLMSGYPDGNFEPDKPCTRAELAAVAVRTYSKVKQDIFAEIIKRLEDKSEEAI